jgi:hypothetical protein
MLADPAWGISMVLRPGVAEGQPAEPAADRGRFVEFSPAAGAAGQVPGNGGSGTFVEGADDVGADLALPVGACSDHVSPSRLKVHVFAGRRVQ